MLTVTKQFKFCYGHHLPDYDGKCKNFHGHNSTVEVTVGKKGAWTIDNDVGDGVYKGMVLDFTYLKETIQMILDELDHKNLNEVLSPTFLPPTCENITMYIVVRLQEELQHVPGHVQLEMVRVSETDSSWATWTRDK